MPRTRLTARQQIIIAELERTVGIVEQRLEGQRAVVTTSTMLSYRIWPDGRVSEVDGSQSMSTYEALASALRERADRFDEDGAVRFGVESAAKAISDVFALDDPGFEPKPFLEAVGVEL
jgi:hypothetical protein